MATANVVFSPISGNLLLMDGHRITSEAVASGAASEAAPSGTAVARITPIGGPMYVAFSVDTPDPASDPRIYLEENNTIEVVVSAGIKVGALDALADEVILLSTSSVTGDAVYIQAGAYNWVVYGVWDGANADLEYSPDEGTTWLSIGFGEPLTENGGLAGVPLATGHVRVAIANAGTTSLTSKLNRV